MLWSEKMPPLASKILHKLILDLFYLLQKSWVDLHQTAQQWSLGGSHSKKWIQLRILYLFIFEYLNDWSNYANGRKETPSQVLRRLIKEKRSDFVELSALTISHQCWKSTTGYLYISESNSRSLRTRTKLSMTKPLHDMLQIHVSSRALRSENSWRFVPPKICAEKYGRR